MLVIQNKNTTKLKIPRLYVKLFLRLTLPTKISTNRRFYFLRTSSYLRVSSSFRLSSKIVNFCHTEDCSTKMGVEFFQKTICVVRSSLATSYKQGDIITGTFVAKVSEPARMSPSQPIRGQIKVTGHTDKRTEILT